MRHPRYAAAGLGRNMNASKFLLAPASASIVRTPTLADDEAALCILLCTGHEDCCRRILRHVMGEMRDQCEQHHEGCRICRSVLHSPHLVVCRLDAAIMEGSPVVQTWAYRCYALLCDFQVSPQHISAAHAEGRSQHTDIAEGTQPASTHQVFHRVFPRRMGDVKN